MSKSAVTRAVNGTVSTLPLVIAVCAISATVFFGLGWAATTRVPELVRASGQIGPLTDLARIDHFDGGVVQELYVQPGTKVKKGQLLAMISQPNLPAELQATEQAIATLERDRLRLNTVLESLSSDAPVPLQTEDSALGAYIASQDALFRARRDTMRARIDRLTIAVDAAEKMQANALTRLEIAQEAETQGAELAQTGVISRATLSERRDATQQVRQTVLEADLQLLQARDRVQEAQGQLAESESAWREELIAKLYEVDGQLSALAVQRADMTRKLERSDLRAPQDGVIQNITAPAIGEVVAPGGTVMDMLPSDDELVAIVKLAPRDIGHVYVGAPVSIRPTTFDFRRFGDIQGEISGIAPTTEKDEHHQPFFRTVIALRQKTIGTGAAERALRAGMEVSADITTSDRTVLSYFLKPAERVLAVSLSER